MIQRRVKIKRLFKNETMVFATVFDHVQQSLLRCYLEILRIRSRGNYSTSGFLL